MKIEKRECNNTTQLKYIGSGDCFYYGGSLFMRFDEMVRDDHGVWYTCVNLSSGLPLPLELATEVEPVEAKVVIE